MVQYIFEYNHKFSEYKKLKIATYSFTLKFEDLPSNYFYIVYQINFGKTETYINY